MIREKPINYSSNIKTTKHLKWYYLHAIGHEMLEATQKYNYLEDQVVYPLNLILDEIRNYIVIKALHNKFHVKFNPGVFLIHTNIYNVVLDLINILGEKEVITILNNPTKDILILNKLKNKLNRNRYKNFIYALENEDYIISHLILLEYLLTH